MVEENCAYTHGINDFHEQEMRKTFKDIIESRMPEFIEEQYICKLQKEYSHHV